MSLLRNLRIVVPSEQRKKVVLLLVMMIISAALEAAGVASIMPFMALLTNPNILQESPRISEIAAMLDLSTTQDMQIAAGACTLLFLVLGNGCALLTNWMLLRFAHHNNHLISCRMLAHYLSQPYEYFLNNNSAAMSKNTLNEINRITLAVIIPVLQMLAKGCIAAGIIVLLLWVNPLMALIVGTAVSGLYSVLYLFFRRRLALYGTAAVSADTERFKSVLEAFSGIKEILLSGRQNYFINRYAAASHRHSSNLSVAECLALLPRFALETIAFGTLIIIALYMLHNSASPTHVLPVLALYALAGYRLMPAMQQIYSGLVQTRYHAHALHAVAKELEQLPPAQAHPQQSLPPEFNRQICGSGLHFSYQDGRKALHNVNLAIKRNTTVGLAGVSGAGKTTLADILLGLLIPGAGKLQVDDVPITLENMRGWQSLLAYVPQSIYLSDDSIAANIAFGIPPELRDDKKIEQAARHAHLHEFILTLPDGYATKVGERGVNLSGGQRQRIGIARALYSQPQVLVLDEATSALDNLTENAVMEAIAEMSGQLTLIIIAHRLSTLKACDTIFMMDGGRIIATGSYKELIENNKNFGALAKGYA